MLPALPAPGRSPLNMGYRKTVRNTPTALFLRSTEKRISTFQPVQPLSRAPIGGHARWKTCQIFAFFQQPARSKDEPAARDMRIL